MAPLKMVIIVIVMILASLLGSKPAAGQIGGIDQFLRNVTDVLHQIKDNVRPPFPTAWFQATLVLALVWMLAPLLVNLWDATMRGSKRVTSLPERTYAWLHPKLQVLDSLIQLFRDHHTTANHQAIVGAITSVRDVFTEDALVQARRQRDDAIQSRDAIVAAKALVGRELNESTLSLRKVEAELEKVAAELRNARQQRDDALASRDAIRTELSAELKAAIMQRDDADASCKAIVAAKSLEKAEAELSSARVEAETKQNVLKRLDDIEHRTKKLEDDATTMANKQLVSMPAGNDG